MSQDFSNDLKISIITEGSESNAWGGITNNNLLQISKAIGGFKTVTVSGTSHTLTPADNTSDQDFRNLVLDITGSVSATPFPLNLPAIDKMYIVKNRLDRDLKVLVLGQTGVIVPTSQTAVLYIDGTDVRDAITYLSSLTLGSALTVKNGGTGYSALTTGSILVGNATSSPTLLAGSSAGQVLKWSGSTWEAGSETGGGGGGSASVSLTAGTAIGGVTVSLTPSTITGTGTVGLTGSLDLGSVTGTLAVANGGTGGTNLITVANGVGIINGTNSSLQTIVSDFQINKTTPIIYLGATSNYFGFNESGSQLNLVASGSSKIGLTASQITIASNVATSSDGTFDLGASSSRFKDVYATNGNIVTSDNRKKNSIQNTDLGLTFINALTPRKYKYNQGSPTVDTSGTDKSFPKYTYGAGVRFHYGLVSQEVEAVLDAQGVDKSLFGGWILADKSDATSDQSLRYQEFISPMMKAIQELSEKVTTLEAKVKELEAK